MELKTWLILGLVFSMVLVSAAITPQEDWDFQGVFSLFNASEITTDTIESNNYTFTDGHNITSNSTCVKIRGSTSTLEIC